MPKKDSTLRIIELIKEKGLSPKEIHKVTGIKYNTITNALGDNNRNFTIEQIAEICEVFDFNQTYCVFGRGEKYGYKASDKIEIKDDLNFGDIKEIAKELADKERTISYLQYQLDMLKNAFLDFHNTDIEFTQSLECEVNENQSFEERLLSIIKNQYRIIQSQQRTIENLSKK